MQSVSWFKRRSSQFVLSLVGLLLVFFTFLAAAPFSSRNVQNQQGLDPRILKIMNSSPYRHGEWGLLEVDPATGRIIHSLDPAQRFFNPGSTAKIVSVSGALDTLGFNHRFTTPVFAVGQKNGGSLTGNLILVAQGDLTMGGRTKPDGTVDFTNLDHLDANSIPGPTLTPEDPLAGLNLLAKQVKAAGITQVKGDVVIDDRLFQPDPILNPAPDPMIINDNVIDVEITPGVVGGGPKSDFWRPQVAPYHLDVQVKTVAAGQPTTLEVQTFPNGRVLVSGDIAADAGQQLRTGDVVDPAAFARTALIEALGRAGVSVGADPIGSNPVSKLPANGSYQGDPRAAAYVSPPFREYTKLILKVSHNLGANLVVCLMAVKAGSSNCEDGLQSVASFLDRAHVDRDQVSLADGRGDNVADRVTPQSAIEVLDYWLRQPEGTMFRSMLPILGVDGSLATTCANCPAKGKVFAKTGTNGRIDYLNLRIIVDKALAGYLEVSPGRYYVFYLIVNGAIAQDINGLLNIGNDLGAIVNILQQEAAK